MKRVFKTVGLLTLATTMLLTGCSKKASESTEASKTKEGKVLRICVWNEEFQERFKTYFEKKGLLPEGVTVDWVVTANQGNAYQNKLDELLYAQESAAPEDRIDLFLVEADYAMKYVDSGFVLDVKKDIGITDADLSKQYKYTQDVMTDSEGVLRGVSWQACPGGFVYRRSIAKDVLGTDDPAEVQKYLNNWDKFDEVAAQAKAKGYFMLSGFDDAYRVFSDNATSPVVINGKINIDPSIKRWIKMTKEYTDKGYNNKANLWSSESYAGATKNGKVFGYFGPAWFIDFCLAPATLDDPDAPKTVGNGSYGDWAFCMGPQGFCWGGTWICAAKGSDNIQLIHDVMYKLTCEEETMTTLAKEYGDFANNEDAMKKVAASDYQNPFLGGQNHISLFLESAKSINKSNMTAYDQGFTEKLQGAFADYYNGKVDEAKAWDNFYTSMKELYPTLSK